MTTKAPKTPKYDAATAEHGFNQLKKERAAATLPDVMPRLDMQAVAALAVGIALDIRKNRKRFASLREELDQGLVDRIGPAAWALWYAAVKRQTAAAGDSEAKVSAATVTAATALRETMLKVCEYHLEDDAAAMKELADIRSGTGYADLASDLSRLAALYAAHAAELRGDKKYYQPGDRKRAGDLGARIVAELGANERSAAKRATEEVTRAYVVLETAYRRVRLAAALLFDGDGFEERYPSLYSVRESTAPKKPAGTAASTGNGATVPSGGPGGAA